MCKLARRPPNPRLPGVEWEEGEFLTVRNSPPAPPRPPLDVTPHLGWATAIARKVRAEYRFRASSQEEQDLEAVALLFLVDRAAAFDPARVPPGGDPGGAFRGYCHARLRGECQREAVRLRNGGAFESRRPTAPDGTAHPPVIAPPLSDFTLSGRPDPDGKPVEFGSRGSPRQSRPGDDPPGWDDVVRAIEGG